MGKVDIEEEEMGWNGWLNHDLEIWPSAAHLLV